MIDDVFRGIALLVIGVILFVGIYSVVTGLV